MGIVLLVTSCNERHPSSAPSREVRLYHQAEPFCLDPRRGGDRRSQLILRHLFEGLTRLDENRKPHMAVAASVRISPDKRTYTFLLRPTFWSNGEPVTAHDFVFAWRTAVDPDTASPFAYAYFVLKNARSAFMRSCPIEDIGVRALSNTVLEVCLEHPIPYFLELVSNPLFSPVCRSACRSDPKWASNSFPHYVSNGPFILKEHIIKSRMILEKNPYYDTPPKSSRIIYTHIEDPHTAYSLYERHELDWYGEPCGFIPIELVKELSYQKRLHIVPTGAIYWIVCCTDKPHLASAKIRHALSCAINRDEICRLLLQGGEQPAASILPTFLSLVTTSPVEDNQVEKAKILFEEGLRDTGYTRETYPALTITHWSERQSTLIAQVIQQQIQNALGIRVLLDACEWSTYMGKVPTGNIDLATAPWYSWASDPAFNLNYLRYRNNGINGTRWQNATYVHLLEQADVADDESVRKRYLKAAEELALQELPLIPLYYMSMKFTHPSSLSGEIASPLGFIEMKGVGWENEHKEGP